MDKSYLLVYIKKHLVTKQEFILTQLRALDCLYSVAESRGHYASYVCFMGRMCALLQSANQLESCCVVVAQPPQQS